MATTAPVFTDMAAHMATMDGEDIPDIFITMGIMAAYIGHGLALVSGTCHMVAILFIGTTTFIIMAMVFITSIITTNIPLSNHPLALKLRACLRMHSQL